MIQLMVIVPTPDGHRVNNQALLLAHREVYTRHTLSVRTGICLQLPPNTLKVVGQASLAVTGTRLLS